MNDRKKLPELPENLVDKLIRQVVKTRVAMSGSREDFDFELQEQNRIRDAIVAKLKKGIEDRQAIEAIEAIEEEEKKAAEIEEATSFSRVMR